MAVSLNTQPILVILSSKIDENDIIIVSDLDEIPNLKKNVKKKLMQKLYQS